MARKSSVIGRQIRRAGAAIKKRYFKGKGYMHPNIGNMAKDIARVKALINVEKKRVLTTLQGNVGQVNGNVDGGWLALDLTPKPAEDSTYSGRSGQSIKVSSLYMSIQFSDMANSSSPMRLKYMIIQTEGAPLGATQAVQNYFNSNPYIQAANSTVIRDIQSPFDPSYRGNFKIHRTGYIKVSADNYSGQKVLTTRVIKHRFNRGKGHHVRYQGNSTTVSSGEYFIVFFADSGNIAGTASTLTGVPVTGASTGQTLQLNCTTYYVDN